MKKKKDLKKLLAKIEFSLLDDHIKVTGLIDSGNSLYDSKTKLPVIVISKAVLRKYIADINYEIITLLLAEARREECLVVDGHRFEIPILEVKRICIDRDGEKKEIKCVLGVVEHKIYDTSNFECLIHKDFI